jgi:hypothetical protein
MEKRRCKGDKLQVSIGGVYVDVLGITKIDGPNPEVQFGDVTDLASTCIEDAEPTGLSKPGSIKFSGFYDPLDNTHRFLMRQITNSVTYGKAQFKAILGTQEFPFTGTLKSMPPKSEKNGFLMTDGEIMLNALPTFPSPS